MNLVTQVALQDIPNVSESTKSEFNNAFVDMFYGENSLWYAFVKQQLKENNNVLGNPDVLMKTFIERYMQSLS